MYVISYYGNDIYQTATGKYFLAHPYIYFESLLDVYNFVDQNNLHKF